jgi:hypothetical protein
MPGEESDRGNELAQDREHRADVHRQLVLLDKGQDVGETPARHAIGKQQERIPGGTIEATGPGVERVTDAGQAGDPFADGAGKAGRRDEVRVERQDLHRIAGFGVEPRPARAKAVLKDQGRVDAGGRSRLLLGARCAPVAKAPARFSQGFRVDSQFVRVVATSIPTRSTTSSY